jgi:hypothetical protein
LLLTQAIIRFKAELTLPSLAITALFRLMKALLMAGLRCMVRTELGQNPRVSLKNFASSLVSKSCSGDKGVTNAIIENFNGIFDFTI